MYNQIAMFRNFYVGIIGISLLVLVSCGGELGDRMKDRPSAFGPLNQINVVADQKLWENVKDSFSYYFAAPYPLLPQPEPIFDIRHFTPSDLIASNARKHLRVYVVMASTEDSTSSTFQIIKRDITSFDEGLGENGYSIKVARDKWANNQLLVYIYAENRQKLIKAFTANYNRIIRQIRNFENDALGKQIYIGGTNKVIPNRLRDSFNFTLKLPKDAQIAIINEDVAWIRNETKDASSSILLSKMPYDSTEQLSKEGIIEIRNRLTREYIKGTEPASYAVVNDEDLPVLYGKIRLSGYDAYEIRGVWEMKNAFMGGPFVTYMVLGPNLESLYLVDIFVYAPGEDKRELIQKLEHIVSTLKIIPVSQ